MIEHDGATYWDAGDVANALGVSTSAVGSWWDGGAPRPALRVRVGGRGPLRLLWLEADVLEWAREHPAGAYGPRPCLAPGYDAASLPPPVPSPTRAELGEALRVAAAEVAAELRAGGRWCTAGDVMAVYAGTTRGGCFEEFERSTLILGLLRKRGIRSRRRRGVRYRDEARSNFV